MEHDIDAEVEEELADCGWWTITATDLRHRALLLGVRASVLLP